MPAINTLLIDALSSQDIMTPTRRGPTPLKMIDNFFRVHEVNRKLKWDEFFGKVSPRESNYLRKISSMSCLNPNISRKVVSAENFMGSAVLPLQPCL